ncbi:MAG: hypothetical protein GYA42_00830 [Syntrophomonadaceae bacterium]|nr:hypothetical protein [Syntrophomonadaceae bacterium]
MKKQVWQVLTGNSKDNFTNLYGVFTTENEARMIGAQLQRDNPGEAVRVVPEETEIELLGLLPGDATDEEIDEFCQYVCRVVQGHNDEKSGALCAKKNVPKMATK